MGFATGGRRHRHAALIGAFALVVGGCQAVDPRAVQGARAYRYVDAIVTEEIRGTATLASTNDASAATDEPSSSATSSASALSNGEKTAPAPATVEQQAVVDDLTASFVRSPTGAVPRVIFFAGVCSNAYAYLVGFPEALRAAGGGLAIEGDAPCPYDSAFRSFTNDPEKQEKRIETALTALGFDGEATPEGGFTLVGYSRGATIAERMHELWPERYPRVVLIGSPADPRIKRLENARAVATMSCSLDQPQRMKGAALLLSKQRVPAKYFEMPGCTHGNLADAENVFGDVFRWLRESER